MKEPIKAMEGNWARPEEKIDSTPTSVGEKSANPIKLQRLRPDHLRPHDDVVKVVHVEGSLPGSDL